MVPKKRLGLGKKMVPLEEYIPVEMEVEKMKKEEITVMKELRVEKLEVEKMKVITGRYDTM